MATIFLPCPNVRLAIDSPAINRMCLFQKRKTTFFEGVWLNKAASSVAVNKPVPSRPRLILSRGSNSELYPSSPIPSDTINQFYCSINEKKLQQLEELISKDCYFEDYSFPSPFQGRKEVAHFYKQLIECSGKNIKFVIDSMCEGDKLTVGVMWHLEWDRKPIPFTRGCSFYECSKQEEGLVIKKAQVLIESPIKPGSLMLTLLKMVSTVFDEFPTAATNFLHHPSIVLQFLLRIYHIFLGPFIHPFMVFYINFWKFMVKLLSYMLNILFHIGKLFK